jgi:hypothetical protein
MPVSSATVSVGTAAVKIVDGKTVFSQANRNYDPSILAKFVYLQDGDFDGDTTTFVGGSTVATTSGILLSKTNTTVFQLHQGDDLYAISSGAGGSVRVVEVG